MTTPRQHYTNFKGKGPTPGAAILFIVLAVVFAFALWRAETHTNDVNRDVTQEITKVKSACVVYGPESKQCEASINHFIVGLSKPQACALVRKAGLNPVSCRNARLPGEVTKTRNRKSGERAAAKHRGAPTSHSPAQSSPAPTSPQSPAPTAPGGIAPSSTGHPASPTRHPHQASPPSPASTQTPSPQSGGQESGSGGAGSAGGSPAAPAGPVAGSATQPAAPTSPSPVPSSPLLPPIEVEVLPELPVHVCVPGVLGVNCPR